MMGRLASSRFNPKPGILDFWSEFRKPNRFRWPILALSMVPFAVIFYWLSSETAYKTPERPQITYITTFDPDRSDAEIMASNMANQEVKELREAAREDLEERKRDLYKALGAAAGMDVEEIDRRGREARAAEERAEQERLDALLGRTGEGGDSAAALPSGTESPAL
ncbi:hypothetical protein [Erythrobacter sp.]|jgi:hypothetical protein|uniref:hypothetical protein n=1 Tax=Erythrobacter sp. TaxID=1042 RepID=UPI002EAE6BD9|nr:hypothetical protein [Erythrobacter sp.]